MRLDVQTLPIPDVKLIRSSRVADVRGYFCETYARPAFLEQNLDYDFVQDNQSSSAQVGTIRGLHFQQPPFAQAKLVRVLNGRILDVVVDLRRSSASYGQHIAVELGGADDEQLLVPAGFAYGFCSLEPNTVVFYKVDAVYSAAHDRGLNWADPKLAIKWPVTPENAVLTEKDRKLPMLDKLTPVFD